MFNSCTYDVCSGLDNFIVIGVNYHNADTSTRSNFSVSNAAYDRIAESAAQKNIKDIFVLSTCNRTEVYGIAPAELLTNMLCEATGNPVSGFKQHGYVYQGMAAVMHLFKVAAGLDSQIIGDYEILMQLKKATKYAKEKGLLGTLLDRLVNFALQASKRVKSETRLSTGTVSVAYAAIEVIREKVPDIKYKNILLVGAGKFGCNVAKNINAYFPGARVRITNRTHQKAEAFAQEYGLECVPYETLSAVANESDVLIASTAAESFNIIPSFFSVQKPRLLLDLSVPKSIDPAVKFLPGTTLMDVDEISAILDNTFAMRKAEVPKALTIIQETLGEFVEWHKIFLHRHFLGEVKSKLYEISETHSCVAAGKREKEVTDARIQKAVKTLAVDLRTRTAKGCQYISTINEYLQMNPS
ncbi:glutamyl-tRNA reductase [Agriterribacter humi]|uniref:glutamyl-tRNA reductase n=1 Tax=Agriterribacter humi TaxID=1104781 RepID=UPI0012648E40|nr:glutamyl-tRNA reductase [Agriterribacter humi]